MPICTVAESLISASLPYTSLHAVQHRVEISIHQLTSELWDYSFMIPRLDMGIYPNIRKNDDVTF